MTTTPTPPHAAAATNPIPSFAQVATSTNAFVIEAAIIAGTLTPHQLDLSQLAHLSGFIRALQRNPSLPLPPTFIERFPHEDRWKFMQIPAIADSIAADLARDGWTLRDNRLRYASIPRVSLPPVIEQALVALYTTERLSRKTMEDIRKHLIFSTPALKTIAHANRAAGAAKAANTRRATKLQTLSPPTAPPIQPPTSDRLILAIQSGKANRLERFNLEHLNPQRLERALPLWLKADPKVLQHLLRVPNLPHAAAHAALEAWGNIDRPVPIDHPFPSSMLTDLSPSALFTILKAALSDQRITIDPWPDPRTFTDLLFTIAINNPAHATWITQTIALRDWHDQIKRLNSDPHIPPAPTDDEAKWVTLLCEHDQYSRATALTLHGLFQRWSPTRQLAMASRLAHLEMNHILRSYP